MTRASNVTQDEINAKYQTTKNVASLLKQVRRKVDKLHAEFPQYKGKFDNYSLFQVPKKVTTKAGVAAEAMDIVLGDLRVDGPCIYSMRTGMCTLLRASTKLRLIASR